MITKVEIRNVAGTLLTLQLDDISNGFVIKDILGLDPVRATIVSSEFAGLDGVQFQSSRRGQRNIIFKIGLEPIYGVSTVRSLRHILYGYFMTKAIVYMRFFDSEGPTVDIQGKVEDAPAPLFTKTPQMSVSILCEDPDFLELDPIVESGSTVSSTTEFTIDYDGTVSTGFKFDLNLNRSLTEFTIYHTPPDGIQRQFNFAGALLNGDILTVSSVTGNKYIDLNRGGTVTSVVYGMPASSSWLEMEHGTNHFRVYAVGAAIPFTITYTNRHGGL